MKNYLDLVPISAKAHRKTSRMTLFCIILSVFLISGIFGMADMFIRSQIIKTRKTDGDWHIALRGVTDGQAELIKMRPDVKYASRYGVKNFQTDKAYTINGKNVIICGCDPEWLTEMNTGVLKHGTFPESDSEALVTENAWKQLGLQEGGRVTVNTPDGRKLDFSVTGYVIDAIDMLKYDSYAIFLNTSALRTLLFPEKTGDNLEDFNSVLYVQFKGSLRIRNSIESLKNAYGLEDWQVNENIMLLGLLGQSGSSFMLAVYSAALVLAVLVMSAGILMISGSLNSSVRQRTEFFGMMRCIGASKAQVVRFVRREALNWCLFAVPAGILSATAAVWILCAALRHLSPEYFGEMPAFSISLPGAAAGAVIGTATVLFAAFSPAKRASRVSPVVAASGNSSDERPVRKAANTSACKIESALGIHHACASLRGFALIAGSFALSVILFLTFSVTVSFMNHAINRMRPWTPDLSFISSDYSNSVPAALLGEIERSPAVKRAYGRGFLREQPVLINGAESETDFMSCEKHQLSWMEDYLIGGAGDTMETVSKTPMTGLALYSENGGIKTGDTVSVKAGDSLFDIKIVGLLSQVPFDFAQVVVCSEDTFRQISGQADYTEIDVQLKRGASETDVDALRNLAGQNTDFSDQRMDNRNVRGTYYSFSLCIYGFLVLITLIAVFNVINSVSMSVSARMKQYGALRAIGLSSRQLIKMVFSEATAYAAAGCVFGIAIGLPLHYFVFSKLISQRWGDLWSVPFFEIGVISFIMAGAVLLSVCGPVKQISKMSIVENISAQ